MADGERFEQGGWALGKEGEINLVRSGLSEVVIIAGGEMMIAWMWECSLWPAMACSHAHTLPGTHTHTPTYTRRRGIFGLKYYRTYPDRLTQAHKCTPSNAFAISVLTDKWALLWCLLENRLFHHFTHFPDVISSGRSSRQPAYFQMQRSSQSHRGRLPVCDVLWLGKKKETVTYGGLQKYTWKPEDKSNP